RRRRRRRPSWLDANAALDYVLGGVEADQRYLIVPALERPLGDQADDLAGLRTGAERLPELTDSLDHRRQRDFARVMDVRGDLHVSLAQVDADRANAVQAAARLPKPRGDLPGDVDVGVGHLDVERGQRRARGHERGARLVVNLLRSEVRAELTAVHAPVQLDQPAGSKERPLPVARLTGEVAVKEDRHLQVRADLPRRGFGGFACRVAVVFRQPDDRADVERPDGRVRAVVLPHIDAVDARPGAVDQRPHDLPGRPAQ